MSSFFTAPASQRKRKRNDGRQQSSLTSTRRTSSSATARAQDQRPPKRHRSESISGSDSGSDNGQTSSIGLEDDQDSIDANETAAEKRLRLAEQYLENIRTEIDEAGFDAADLDRDLIAERLKEDVAESKGKVYRHIADDLDIRHAQRMFFRGDQMDITAVASCGNFVYTAAKDKSVIKWELPSADTVQGDSGNQDTTGEDIRRKKPKFTPASRPRKLAYARGRSTSNKNYLGHAADILCAAASTTGRFLATGGLDRRIVIWDVSSPEKLQPVKVFPQHRDIVTGLAFRRGTNQLYSCSRDRTVKVWSLDELAYVETLFGHQDGVSDITAGVKEVCISVGSRDRTARLWKVGEETQLVFRGGGVAGAKGKFKDKRSDGAMNQGMRDWQTLDPEVFHAEGSIDRIALIDDETFITGSDNGALSLWGVHKKKPLAVVPLAHGLDPPLKLQESYADAIQNSSPDLRIPGPPSARWITALTSIPYSDIVVSGSWDGTIRAWKIRQDRKGIDALGIVGPLSSDEDDIHYVNGTADADAGGSKKQIRGVINDLVIVEKGDRAKDGIAVIAVTSRAHRLGRWSVENIRSTAVKLEIRKKQLTNGVNGVYPVNGTSGHNVDPSEIDT